MRIRNVKERTPLLLRQLLEIWESSVRSTHLFLTDSEIETIKEYVPQALAEVPHLVVAESKDRVPIAFMAVSYTHLLV